MSLSRANRSGFSEWWWTVDRLAFAAMLGLIAIGLMLAFAASPAASGGPLTEGDFHYAAKQIAFALVAAGILGGASMLTPAQVRLAAALVFVLALIGSVATLVLSIEFRGWAGRTAVDSTAKGSPGALSNQAEITKAAAWARSPQSGSAGRMRLAAGSISLFSSTIICPP